MTLLNICDVVSLENRVKYLSLLCRMASVDGKISQDELMFLKYKVDQFQIPSDRESDICNSANYIELDCNSVFNDLKENELEYSFFMDLIAMAMVDGVVMESERELLLRVLNRTKLSLEEYHNMINFAQVVIYSSADYPIDPMYSSIIEMQFHWLTQNKIKLFWQTTFAFAVEIDMKLKHQLVNYNLPG